MGKTRKKPLKIPATDTMIYSDEINQIKIKHHVGTIDEDEMGKRTLEYYV
jgi:hypothetical protein